jgi:hypothetical protein
VANSAYTKFLEHLIGGDVALDTDVINVVLVDSSDYTLNLATHDALDDIPLVARVATATLAGKTVTDGVFDATDTTFTAVSGDPCEGLVLYKSTGVEATSWLIAWIDTATGLPVSPNGSNITVQWPNDATRILALTLA